MPTRFQITSEPNLPHTYGSGGGGVFHTQQVRLQISQSWQSPYPRISDFWNHYHNFHIIVWGMFKNLECTRDFYGLCLMEIQHQTKFMFRHNQCWAATFRARLASQVVPAMGKFLMCNVVYVLIYVYLDHKYRLTHMHKPCTSSSRQQQPGKVALSMKLSKSLPLNGVLIEAHIHILHLSVL